MPRTTSPASPRRTRLEPEVQHERILSSALTAFTRLGYGAATMGDIAEQAAINRPLLYHYFASKHEIYQALLVQTVQHFDALMTRLREHGGAASEQIRLLIEGYHELMQAQPGLALLCIEASTDPSPTQVSAYDKRIAMLRVSLLEWIDSLGPEVRSDVDREQFLLVTLSVLNFFFLPTPFGRALGAGPDAGPQAIERHKAAALDILLHGLVSPARNS